MLAQEYMSFRNRYQQQHKYDPNTLHHFFHTTRIENLESIFQKGLLSFNEAESIYKGLGLGFGPPYSEYFVRIFHSDNTPFLYNRFKEAGCDNIVLLIISSEILDDKSVSIIGMSTHGLSYWKESYVHYYFLQKEKDDQTNDIMGRILQEIPKPKVHIYNNESNEFYSVLSEAFDLPAKGYGWSRGEVLYSERPAYPGFNEGDWGNIRAAEILIYPRIPVKYIIGVAGTQEGRNHFKGVPNDIQIFNLTDQGYTTSENIYL
jgi:hypothetical protein